MAVIWFITGCITGVVCTLALLWFIDAAYELGRRDKR